MSNVAAFLAMVGNCEGANYHTLYGGGTFESFADHPRRSVTAGGYTSTAAGRYQILASTWDDFIRATYPRAFDEAGQDACALWLIERRKALEDVQNGRLASAIAKCGKEWASLPGSPYGQPVRSYAYCEQHYLEAGGVLHAQGDVVIDEAHPASQPEAQDVPDSGTTVPSSGMAQISGTNSVNASNIGHPAMGAALTLLPLLAQFIPQIMTLIKPGSASTAKDAAIAQTVLTAATQAAGIVGAPSAATVGSLVDAMNADPSLVQKVQQAIVSHPDIMPILEIGGGGIKQAKDDSLAMQNAPKSFWYNPAFWITVLLLAMPFMLLADVFYVHPANYTDTNLKTQIVTGVLAVIMVVSGFWLGSSQGSQKKDDALAVK